MNMQDEDLLAFWSKLNEYKVQYMMIGGLATRLHGYNRITDDLDVWLQDTLHNRQNFRMAFKELGYGDYPSIETMEFIPGWTTFYAAGIELDIITKMKGLEEEDFDTCYQMCNKANIDGVIVPFLHINHLIANKKAVNRPKDQLDVIYLEKIKKIREEEER
ncbi:MAG: hypothetical protein H7178_05425 [Chitinophagaceae bacterium]|nr:hypothetical protein [Chitinophagaceae bacterium]